MEVRVETSIPLILNLNLSPNPGRCLLKLLLRRQLLLGTRQREGLHSGIRLMFCPPLLLLGDLPQLGVNRLFIHIRHCRCHPLVGTSFLRKFRFRRSYLNFFI